MKLIKQKNPKANVLWVNVGVDNNKRRAQGNSEINVDQINNTLNDNSNFGYKVIDWKTIAKNNPNYILDDDVDVHPFTTDGGSAYVNTIVSAVSKSTTNTNRIGGSCECSIGVGESAINLVGNNNEKKVWNFLISAGFTKEQAAGVIGNMYAESGVNPRRVQGTRTPDGDLDYPPPGNIGYGLVQWTPGTKILPYAQQKNKTSGDLGFQLGLLVAQLNGTDNTGIAEKNAGDDLKKQTTPEAAAKSFMLKYERPLDQSEEKQAGRAEKAREVFDRLSGGASYASNDACQQAKSSNIGDKIASIAKEQFATGASEANGGYLKYTGGVVSPGGWCDYFVSWVYREAGVPFTGGSGAKGYAMVPVPNMQAYFSNKNSFHPAGNGYVPKPGDVVIWDYKKDGVLDHVSIVVSVDGQKMTTIGGNESDQVSKREYASFDNKDVYGFGSPVK